MVKRRKPRGERREVLIPVRVTVAEKRRLEAGARNAGTGVSTWLRLLGLKAAQKGSEG